MKGFMISILLLFPPVEHPEIVGSLETYSRIDIQQRERLVKELKRLPESSTIRGFPFKEYIWRIEEGTLRDREILDLRDASIRKHQWNLIQGGK